MKKLIITVSAAFMLLSFTMFEMTTWSTDQAHSRLGFTITHLGINDVNGEFKKFEVNTTTSGADFTDAKIQMTAEVASVNTGFEMRDDHLKKEDFFDVNSFPQITFTSKSVKKIKANSYTVTGDLTMHGVTKTVSFNAVHNGNAKNYSGKEVAGFKMVGVIKRSDFKLGAQDYNSILSDEVKLIADIELSKN